MKNARYLILGMALLAGATAYFYFKPAENRAESVAQIEIEASRLYVIMAKGSAEEQSTYLNQVVRVTGVVNKFDGSTLLMVPGISCRMENGIPKGIAGGDEISLKGRVLGFDDMFSEVKMDFGVLD